jgi:hypothetical protein
VCVCSVTDQTMCTLYASHYLSTDSSKCAFVFVATGSGFILLATVDQQTFTSRSLHAYDRLTRDTHTTNSEMGLYPQRPCLHNAVYSICGRLNSSACVRANSDDRRPRCIEFGTRLPVGLHSFFYLPWRTKTEPYRTIIPWPKWNHTWLAVAAPRRCGH